MRIAFVNPDLKIVKSNRQFKRFLDTSPHAYFYNYFWSGFSNGLLTIAALTPAEYDVQYIEDKFETIPYLEKFDIVAITATTQQATRAYHIASKFKEISGGRVVTVMGGSHATFLPEEALRHCDVVFRGEAENAWPVFLADFKRGAWKSIYDSADFEPVEMNVIPAPRYDLLNPAYYKMVWIQTSRGCPRNCEFCSATKFFGSRYRAKSMEKTVADIENARKHLPFQQILFSDDNMFINNERSRNFITEIKKLNISYVAQSDISIGGDIQFLELLKKSGCSILFIGFESLDERNLGIINRSKWKLGQLKNYSAHIENINRAGIGVYGAFIVGYDWDSKLTFKNLQKFITGNYLAGAQVTFLTPLPGTDLRKRYEDENRILDKSWDNYTFFDVNIRHSNLSKRQLERKFLWLYKKIYNKNYLKKKNLYFKNIFKEISE
jgi:radical SAM superfamily enzyme YgiQ (UPF0313 family)